MRKLLTISLSAIATAAGASPTPEQLQLMERQVRAAECSFAATMARRDLAGFERHLAEPAVFFNGREPQHGRAAIVAGWTAYYQGAEAPFSWEPDQIVVVGDGSLAYSTGPVRNPKGEVTHRFLSVWRQEAPGRWRIVIDRGAPLTAADRQPGQVQAQGKGCEGVAP